MKILREENRPFLGLIFVFLILVSVIGSVLCEQASLDTEEVVRQAGRHVLRSSLPDPIVDHLMACFSDQREVVFRPLSRNDLELGDPRLVEIILEHCVDLFVQGGVMPHEIEERQRLILSLDTRLSSR